MVKYFVLRDKPVHAVCMHVRMLMYVVMLQALYACTRDVYRYTHLHVHSMGLLQKLTRGGRGACKIYVTIICYYTDAKEIAP